jgi:hypothetical protein
VDPSVETASKRDSRSERQFGWGLSCPSPRLASKCQVRLSTKLKIGIPLKPMPSASGKRNTARNQPVLVGLPFQILPEIRMRK